MQVSQPSDTEFTTVAAALRKLCQDPLPGLSPDTYLDELPGMDSLRMLHAIASIEEHHGIEIDVAALDQMYRVQDIMNAVRAAQNATLPNTDQGG
jgi:acyl carrier protein